MNVMMAGAAKYLEQMMAAGQKTSNQAPADNSGDGDNRLRALLGDEGFARFKDYSHEIPSRTTLALLKNQLGENSLSEEQSARVMQIVKSEPYELTQGIFGAPDKAFLGSQSDIDNFLQRVTESNQRILQQAGNVLNPDQLAALDSVLNNAVASRKLQAAALIQKH